MLPRDIRVNGDPSEHEQFHAAIMAHEPGTCETCDYVRESGVFARNGRRPMVRGTFQPGTR